MNHCNDLSPILSDENSYIIASTGSLTGIVCSISAMLVAGSMYEGGLNNFFVNTIQDYSLLASMLSGLLVSGTVTVVVSLCTHKIKDDADARLEWSKTMNIDNPLNPFRLTYSKELREYGADAVITTETMEKIFKRPKLFAIIGSVISVLVFIVIIPSIILSIGVFSLGQYKAWVLTFQCLCFFATFISIVMPPIEEGFQIWKQCKRNKEAESSGTLYKYRF